MAVYKRGDVWWYEFHFSGERIRESTKQRNKRVAEQMEAARKTGLAKGEVGIIDKTPAPTFREFAPRFEEAIETLCADRPATIRFYKEKLRRLLEFQPLVSAPLDAIEEALIDTYKTHRTRQASRYGRPMSVASVNRELATLRRLLHLAHEWKLIERVPRVRLLRGERVREFVLSHEREALYPAMAPQPLKDVRMVILAMGLRPGEAAKLEWPEVRLKPADGSQFGYIHVKGINSEGKSTHADRNLSLSSGRIVEMLQARKAKAISGLVFPSEKNPEKPVLVTSLDHQHEKLRRLLKMPGDFVIHSLRHTFGTRLGESGADAFTIMRVMGHSTVTVSQRYVHPSPETLETAFERLEALNVRRRGELHGVPTVLPTVGNRRKWLTRKAWALSSAVRAADS